MNYPSELNQSGIENFQVKAETLEIPKSVIALKRWEGNVPMSNFGGKALLEVNGQGVFAELAIAEIFKRDGWQTRWVETYRGHEAHPVYLTQWSDNPYRLQRNEPIEDEHINDLIQKIYKQNKKRYSGCWDVLAWRGEELIFAEAKRTKKDRITETQKKWLAAAIRVGLKPKNFLVVEWDYKID